MNIKITFIIAILSTIILTDCTGKDANRMAISYSKRVSADSIYQLEVPTEIHNYLMAGDMMSFIKDQGGKAMASVKAVPSNVDLNGYVIDKQTETFTYTQLTNNNPNTCYYKVSRGGGFWSAYDYYGVKDVDGLKYIINLNSDSYSKEMMDSIFSHMYDTLDSVK